jgi:hypothetical protein
MDSSTINLDSLVIYPHYENLKAEVEKLRGELSTLVLEHEDLEIECKNIEMQYVLAIGWLESKVMGIEYSILRLKREIDMIQAVKNLRQVLDLNKVEEALDDEFCKYQEKVNEQAEKVNNAQQRHEQNEKNRTAYEQRNRQVWEEHNCENTEKSTGNEYEHKDEPSKKQAGEKNKDTIFESNNPLQEESGPIAWMKKIYRQIVKALHPDINPDIDETGLSLLRKANAAYEDGDLESLQLYYEAINKSLEIEDGPDAISRLLEEKERIEKLILKMSKMIAAVKSRFPYTMKAFVNDPEKITLRKSELEKHIAQLDEALAAYKEKVAEMTG